MPASTRWTWCSTAAWVPSPRRSPRRFCRVFGDNIDTDTQFAFAEAVGHVDEHPKAFKYQIDPDDDTPYKKFYDPRKWLRRRAGHRRPFEKPSSPSAPKARRWRVRPGNRDPSQFVSLSPRGEGWGEGVTGALHPSPLW